MAPHAGVERSGSVPGEHAAPAISWRDVSRRAISEGGRRLLASLLGAMTEQQIAELFSGARFGAFEQGRWFGPSADERAWVDGFQDKVRQIVEGRPCPESGDHSSRADRPLRTRCARAPVAGAAGRAAPARPARPPRTPRAAQSFSRRQPSRSGAGRTPSYRTTGLRYIVVRGARMAVLMYVSAGSNVVRRAQRLCDGLADDAVLADEIERGRLAGDRRRSGSDR